MPTIDKNSNSPTSNFVHSKFEAFYFWKAHSLTQNYYKTPLIYIQMAEKA